MKPTLIFKTDNKNVKKPTNLKSRVFLIYPPKKKSIRPTQFIKNDTEVTVTLPKEHRGYFTSKFRYDETETIANQHQRTWVGTLDRSLSENIVIHKNKPFGFCVIEPDANINIKYETATAKSKDKNNNNPKKISKKKEPNHQPRRQRNRTGATKHS